MCPSERFGTANSAVPQRSPREPAEKALRYDLSYLSVVLMGFITFVVYFGFLFGCTSAAVRPRNK